MTRVAVIGIGSMGRNHARVYKEIPDVDLVAVVDQDEEKALNIGDLFGAKSYSDYREMLAIEQPTAVSVAAPTGKHFEITKAALESGCHVLVEKPICTNMEDACRLIDISKEMDKVLSVGHIERYNPAIRELKRRISKGDLGKIFHVHARRIGPFPTRIHDVGVILDLATHDLDIMRYITGSEADYLVASTKREIHETHEDLVNGIINFNNGVIGLLEINWITPTKIREFYVTGELGMIKVNYITQDLHFFENGLAVEEDWSALSLLRGVGEGPITQYVIRKMEPLRVELETFLAAVSGETEDYVNGEDGAASLSLALLLLESARENKIVKVN